MPDASFTDALTALGLNRYEATIYVTLVRSPQLTPSQIAARSHVPRQRVYDILATLCRKGLVNEVIAPGAGSGRQRTFTPVDPATALPNLLREYKRQQSLENEQRAHAMKELVAQIRPQYLEANPDNGTGAQTRVVTDPVRLAERLTALADRAERHIACLCTATFPSLDALPALARAAERLSLQMLFPHTATLNSETNEALTQLAEAGAEIRLCEQALFPLASFDECTLILGEANASAGASAHATFEFTSEPIAQFLCGAFDAYWIQATPWEALDAHTSVLPPMRPLKRAPIEARERILEAMRLGQPEPVPASWLGGGIWTINYTKHTFASLIGRPQEMARALIDTFQRTGNPIIFVGSGYNIFHLAPFGAKIQFRVVGHLDLEEPLVRDAAELDAFDLDALAREPAIQTLWEAARLVAAEVGDEALVAATAWGPFNLTAHILGIETLTRALYRNPGQVEKTLHFATRVVKRFFEPLLAEKIIPLVSIADTLAGDHISRAHFNRFVLPYLRDIIAWSKQREARVLLHICGALRDKLDVLGETGADCISLDSRVDLKRAKELFAGKVCVAGNVDPVNVLDHLTLKQVEASARECLVAGAPGGGFILMPGCDLPPTVSLDNVRAMLRAAETWK